MLKLSGSVLIKKDNEELKIPASEFTLAEDCDINIGDGDRYQEELHVYCGEDFEIKKTVSNTEGHIENQECEVDCDDIEIISDNTVVSLVQEEDY